MDVKEFKMELEVGWELFYDDESMFGMFSCKPAHYTREVDLNSFGNFTIKGQTRKLLKGERYVVKFDGPHANTNPKYDDFYQIVEVEPEKLNTVVEQDKFLQAILTKAQMKSLKDAYPDHLLVDMILDDKIDVSKTSGIKEKSLAKIKFQVEQNAGISVLIAKLNTLNLTTNAIDKLLAHFKTSEAVIQAIDENIYNLCKVKQFGFLTVDKVALARGDNPTNNNRITACVSFLLRKDNDNGHTWTPKDELIDSAIDLLDINQDFIEKQLKILKEEDRIYIEGHRVARNSVRKQEMEVFSHLWRIYSGHVKPSKRRVEDRVSSIEEQQEFNFTDEQRNAIVEGSQDGVMVLNGVAGSGKSMTVKGLVDSLGSGNYMTSALSGKAVQVLSQRGIQASTIHRMLGYMNGGFEHNEDNPLPYDIVVVDEMSMVDVRLFLSVLKAIPSGTKLILVGDIGQLPGIGIGNILRDLLETKAFPTYELTEVHRQAAKSGILSLANSVREGNQIMPFNSSGREVYGELQDQTVISYSNKENIPYDILKIAQSYLSNLKSIEDIIDFQVIVSNRERGDLSVRSMNIELQKIFNDVKKPFLRRGSYDYRTGDKIIARGNTYELKSFNSVEDYIEKMKVLDLIGDEDEEEKKGSKDVYNGTMGIIKAIEDKTALIQFEGISGLIAITQKGMDKIDMAYAATVHRLQGSGIENVIFALDYGAYKLLSRQLVYTALTRASKKSVVLCENNAMHKAISVDASSERRTFLRDIIKANST